jgi:uncharacterized membrane protein (UPF0127 family)
VEADDGCVVCERCAVASSFWTRFRGLMGRRDLPRGEGMLFRPGGSVHTFFMRIPIDVVFCGRDLQVVGVAANVRPWRLAGARRTKTTIELAAGEAARRGVEVGTQLRVVE